MKYALQDVESLIHLELNPDTILKSPPDEKNMLVFSCMIREQHQLIRSFLSEEAFSLKKDKAIESLIQRYQGALIKIADELMQYIRQAEEEQVLGNSNASSVRVLYQLALKSVEELLTFIEHHFARYFNIDEKIPESYKLLMQTEFTQNFNALLHRYKRTDINANLLEIVMAPFHRFLSNAENKQFTYRELLYLKILQKELEEFLLPDQHSIIERNLLDILIYLNFNNHRFFNYFVSIIRKDLNDNETINQQLEKLAWWIKTINQLQTKPMVAYKIRNYSAKEQLVNWVSEELAYIQTKHHLANGFRPQATPVTKSNAALTTTISVKQLALLIRLFYDCSVIKFENQTELLNRVAANIKTERKENVSPQSLRTRYYNIDENTKNIVKDLLIRMVNQIRKYN